MPSFCGSPKLSSPRVFTCLYRLRGVREPLVPECLQQSVSPPKRLESPVLLQPQRPSELPSKAKWRPTSRPLSLAKSFTTHKSLSSSKISKKSDA